MIVEHTAGQLTTLAFELTSKGRELADRRGAELAAVLLGSDLAEELGDQLVASGVDKAYLIDNPVLEVYRDDAYVSVLAPLVQEHGPEIVLLGATGLGLSLAPALAARLCTGLSAHCIDLDLDEKSQMVQLVPAVGQACVARILCADHRPQIATVRPGSFARSEMTGHQGSTIRLGLDLSLDVQRVIVVEQGSVCAGKAGRLTEAEVVVAGGAGIGSAEGWALLEELTKLLGGAVGATRPAVDSGWASQEQMIGHSGVSVCPEVYIGVGISGDMLHMIGVLDAKKIIAINRDPHAPIFQQADIGFVSDYREILPGLIRELRNSQ
jgi:electron transfer flavoprotein alpha subunit